MHFLFHGLAARRRSDVKPDELLRWLVPADVKVAYVCARWSLAAPAHHILDVGVRSLEHRLDPSRIEVADPAGKAASVRLLDG